MATTPVISIVPPYTPELLPSVQQAIQRYIQPGCKVLELGSGWSTIWFAMWNCKVLSVEHDNDWFNEVNRVLNKEQLTAHVLKVEPNEFPNIVRAASNDCDIVFVDCIDEQRIPCIREAIGKVKVGGILVVDDTHWEDMKPVFDIMSLRHQDGKWGGETIRGIHQRKTGEIKEHQTTIFKRVV